MPEKLEPGNPPMALIMFLETALDLLLDTTIEKIQSHNRSLSAQVNAALREFGFDVISPLEDARSSGNTCFLSQNARTVSADLEAENVLIWGEYGRVRISTHLYNSSEDVERLISELGKISSF